MKNRLEVVRIPNGLGIEIILIKKDALNGDKRELLFMTSEESVVHYAGNTFN